MKQRNLKISAHDHGDGIFFGASVVDAETGEPIAFVQSVEIKMGMDEWPTAIITVKAPEVCVIVHESAAQIVEAGNAAEETDPKL